MTSAISGFYDLSIEERMKVIKEFAKLDESETEILKQQCALDNDIAQIMIENVVGTTHLPVGIATYFLVNGKDYLIPMAIEEPSIVAAASHSAKMVRESGGFRTSSTNPIMIGQISLKVKDTEKAGKLILGNLDKIKSMANKQDSTLIKRGGGLVSVDCRRLDTDRGEMLVVHLNVDVRDAMGANAVNTMAESVAPFLEELTDGVVVMKIISNLATKRLVTAEAVWKKEILGEALIEGILDAYAFAKADPYRATTNNKGAMNGVDAVLIATGNDFRAVESGAHSYASISGKYQPLVEYNKNKNGDLVGKIELPMAVGIVGGSTKTNPIARIALKILGVKSANELGELVACVGLANNFAAVRAIVKEGINKGHLKLHSKNIAIIAGAEGEEVHKISEKMTKDKCISVSYAEQLLKEMRS